MKKNDARVRYTQKVLKDSLLQLLEKKPINKITVKEVCELAELNRATFYAHYTDCLDLLESIENEKNPRDKIGKRHHYYQRGGNKRRSAPLHPLSGQTL